MCFCFRYVINIHIIYIVIIDSKTRTAKKKNRKYFSGYRVITIFIQCRYPSEQLTQNGCSKSEIIFFFTQDGVDGGGSIINHNTSAIIQYQSAYVPLVSTETGCTEKANSRRACAKHKS